jgi:hypothetical protein
MVKVVDNFLPVEEQNALEQLLIGNSDFPYYQSLDTLSPLERFQFKSNKIIHQPQFVHVLFTDDNINSDAFDTIFSKFNLAGIHEFINPSKFSFERIKVNLLTPCLSRVKNLHHVPHVDSFKPNTMSMIYYVCDSDGDTFIFNERYSKETIPNKLTLKQRIEPKKGRAVFFDSDLYHASSPPSKKDFRCIVNSVFKARQSNIQI